LALLVLGVACLPVAARAQWVNPPSASEYQRHPDLEHATFKSPSMAVEIEYSVVLPPGYGTSGRSYPVIYWLHGGGGGESTDLFTSAVWSGLYDAQTIDPVILVYACGQRSSYMDHADGKTLVETMIVKELIPLIDSRYRTIAERGGRAVHGFSMGADSCLKLVVKYPDLFCSAIAYGGGASDLENTVDPFVLGLLSSHLDSDPARIRDNNPYHFLRANSDTLRRNGLQLRVVVGSADPWLPTAHSFKKAAEQVHLPCEVRIVPGVGHDLSGLMAAQGAQSARFQDKIFKKWSSQRRRAARAPKAAPRP
jgi:enterochelin esterase-like enzyme